jgi:hypothetical protein
VRRKESRSVQLWCLSAGAALLVLGAAFEVWLPAAAAQGDRSGPVYRVDANWPKPFPLVKDAKGNSRSWVTGEVGGTCIDSHEHIVTLNRGFLGVGVGAIGTNDGPTAMAAPPVILYDTEGNVVASWGDPTLSPEGPPKTMPGGFHGCFVDYQDNIWIGGNNDGVVQKWSHDGKMLMQIGQKGVCDGAPNTSKGAYSTCGSPGLNNSQTLLNDPADIAVDANPDPVTGQRGSVYIADGYGNHRIAVFDSNGKFLRQWGSRGDGPGQFGSAGRESGGHPHCVVLSNDGLVYTCDRGNNRLQVFDKTGTLKRTIKIDPPEFGGNMMSHMAANDMAFSNDKAETFIFDTDIDTMRIWILNKQSGKTLGGFGRPGHQAGEFNFPHAIVTDSRGSLYISETVGGRRNQKFVKQ